MRLHFKRPRGLYAPTAARCPLALTLRLLQGTYGSFKRKQDAVVPLWLAIRLRSDHKADIVCPPWLTVEALRAAYARETSPQNASTLTVLPVFYLEIASLLFKHAADNIADVEQARQLVKDLEEVRAEKLRKGRSQVVDGARTGTIATVLSLDNVGFLEAAALSADLLPLLDELGKLERAQTAADMRRRGMGAGGGPGPSGPGPLSGSGPSGPSTSGASLQGPGTAGSAGGAASAVSAAAAEAAAAVGRRYAGLGLGQLGGSRRAAAAAAAAAREAAEAGASSAAADTPADAGSEEGVEGLAGAAQGVSTASLMAQAAEQAAVADRAQGTEDNDEDASEQQPAE